MRKSSKKDTVSIAGREAADRGRAAVHAYMKARERGDTVVKNAYRTALFEMVPQGMYRGPIDLQTLEMCDREHEVGILGVAKCEVTHAFEVVVLREDMCFPLPLLQFLGVSGYFTRSSISHKHLLEKFTMPLTRNTALGTYRHTERSETYHHVGTLTDLRSGSLFALCLEDDVPFTKGLRIRPTFGERGFHSAIRRTDGPQKQRFEKIMPWTPQQMLEHIGGLKY